METDKFEKPFIKAGDLQARMGELLAIDPDVSSLDMADQLYDWFIDCDRPRQIEVLSYAISHLRPTVKRKLSPEAKTNGQAAARRLLLMAKAKWLLSLTYEQLGDAIEHGPTLREKMRPGQRVKDVWKQSQVERMLR